MSPCPKSDLVSQKRQKLINDLQELIDCMQLGPSAPPAAKTGSTGGRKIVCLPCPDGDRNRGQAGDGSRTQRVKDTELKGGILIPGCQCIKRNGLQHDCPRSECMGRPACLVKPWPDCLPSGGTGLKGAEPRTSKYPYRPAPCPMPDMPPGYEEDPCHRAEVDCAKCVPVLMCRPGEDPGSNPDAMRMNVMGQITACTKFVRDTSEPSQQQCRPANPQPIQQTLPSECGGVKHSDPPTHCMKQTAYAVRPEVPVSVRSGSMECVPAMDSCKKLTVAGARNEANKFKKAIYRKPPRSTVDDWKCQLPCKPKKQPCCLRLYGEGCYWHRPVPVFKASKNEDLFMQW